MTPTPAILPGPSPAREVPRVFLSARYDRRIELRLCRAHLQAAGYEVHARWIDGQDEPSPAGPTREEAVEWILMDLADLSRADLVICFTEEPTAWPKGSSRGGRHVEFGLALAAGKRILVVGPRENLFHWQVKDDAVFPTWAACLEQLDFNRGWGLS